MMSEYEELLRAAIIAMLDVRIVIKNNNLDSDALDESLISSIKMCSDEVGKNYVY